MENSTSPRTRSVTVETPAKINLLLDVVGKRTDGYHFMKTIMQSVSIFDKLTIVVNDSKNITVTCDNPDIPCDERNLAYRAAAAFFAYTEIPTVGMEIDIKKEIPIQSGLGGGSSNAAGVLIALNEMFATELSDDELAEIGVGLGADVPFCLTGGTALAEGIGEFLMPLPHLEECYIVVAKPKIGICTAEAFTRFDESAAKFHPDCDEIIAAIVVGDVVAVAAHCRNVLEESTKIEEIREIKRIMTENEALCAVMSGSGSAVFGIFEKKRVASSCADELEKVADFVKVCVPVECGIEVE